MQGRAARLGRTLDLGDGHGDLGRPHGRQLPRQLPRRPGGRVRLVVVRRVEDLVVREEARRDLRQLLEHHHGQREVADRQDAARRGPRAAWSISRSSRSVSPEVPTTTWAPAASAASTLAFATSGRVYSKNTSQGVCSTSATEPLIGQSQPGFSQHLGQPLAGMRAGHRPDELEVGRGGDATGQLRTRPSPWRLRG